MIAPELIDALDQVMEQVGLTPAQSGSPRGRLWTGLYAYVLFWEAGESLKKSAEEAKAALDGLMQADGIDGETKVVDGYVILAMARAPHPHEAGDVHAIELNTSVCRIQVVWPEDGEWRGLSTLTFAAPPTFTAQIKAAAWPDFTPDLQSMFDELQKTGGKELAAKDVKEVEPER